VEEGQKRPAYFPEGRRMAGIRLVLCTRGFRFLPLCLHDMHFVRSASTHPSNTTSAELRCCYVENGDCGAGCFLQINGWVGANGDP